MFQWKISFLLLKHIFYCYIFQCLLAVLEGKEYDQRHPDEMHDNEAFEDDEGIAESGM